MISNTSFKAIWQVACNSYSGKYNGTNTCKEVTFQISPVINKQKWWNDMPEWQFHLANPTEHSVNYTVTTGNQLFPEKKY